MTSPIPFTLEDWKRLAPQGWRFAVGSGYNEDAHYIGVDSRGYAIYDLGKDPLTSRCNKAWILPPRQVIEFSVGLFEDKYGDLSLHVIDSYWCTSSPMLKRLITKDEMRDGVVEL